MERFLRDFFHIFHGVAGILGILLNLILLYASIKKSPSTIKTYSILIVNFAITDLAAAILSVFIEQRVIPVYLTLVHVSYGFCIHFGPQFCYAGYSMMLHFFMHSQWCLLLSFCYRLFVLKNSTPKASRLLGIIFLVYIPSFIQFVTFIFSQGDPEYIFKMVHQRFPEYEFDLSMVTGNINIFSPFSMYTILYMTLPIFPIYGSILLIRSKIIHCLETSTNHLRKHTKELHHQLLRVLTYQSFLPCFLIFAVNLFCLELLGIYNHPIIEFSIFASLSLIPVFSPIIYLYYVTPYRKWLTCSSSKNAVQNSSYYTEHSYIKN